DLLMIPGRLRTFKVRTFNANGQLLQERPDDAEFAMSMLGAEASEDVEGQLGEDGTFLAPSGDKQVAALVTGKVGELSGTARVRIVPNLPWEFDFNEMKEPPITWVGARYRHIIRDIDGDNSMVKISTIPKGARSRAWMGHSNLSNYTIQADVKGSVGNDRQPDIGLIAQGYVLDMQGVASVELEDGSGSESVTTGDGGGKQLQIRTWVPQRRMAKELPFNWSPDTWYTMKLQASVVDGKAILKGKVWPREEEEPAEWMLEATDDAPVLEGSPGLYGNAKDAEIFLDNIKVYDNPKADDAN
ncbi:MAG: hypothetical protein NXI22_25275, partial [bacterium]|nr:hypothetical protein [bacterium]